MNEEDCKRIVLKMVAKLENDFLHNDYIPAEDKATYQAAAEILLADHPGLPEAAFLAEKRESEARDRVWELRNKAKALGIPWCSIVRAGNPDWKPKTE